MCLCALVQKTREVDKRFYKIRRDYYKYVAIQIQIIKLTRNLFLFGHLMQNKSVWVSPKFKHKNTIKYTDTHTHTHINSVYKIFNLFIERYYLYVVGINYNWVYRLRCVNTRTENTYKFTEHRDKDERTWERESEFECVGGWFWE